MNNNILPFDDQATIAAEAREWLIRLDRDDPPSKAELSALRQWAAQSSAHQTELERISASGTTPISLTSYQHQSTTAPASPGAACWAKSMPPAVQPQNGSAPPPLPCLPITVTLAIMPPPIDASNGLYITAIGEVQEQRLVDGSVLQLNTDSQVQVSYSDGMRKIRLLKGEAHFEVASNKQWPFQVYAGNGMVKAVGTAFSVRLNPEQVNVVVSEGVVDIASVMPANHTVPNQPATAPAERKLASLTQGQASQISNNPAQGISHSARHQNDSQPRTAAQTRLAHRLPSLCRRPPQQRDRRDQPLHTHQHPAGQPRDGRYQSRGPL